ncbi:hypothetical protein Tco_0406710, partial [Tanacetum coccineum]
MTDEGDDTGQELNSNETEVVNWAWESSFSSTVGKNRYEGLATTKAFKVYIGSGESLLCENVCSQVTLGMQGLSMEVDLYVLPMKGPDVVR